MSYTSFETLKEVMVECPIKVKSANFIRTKSFKIEPYLQKILIRNMEDRITILSEASVCENIIAPIMQEVAYFNNLTVWSHTQFDLEGSNVLKGVPDYLIGIIDDDATSIRNPILCLAEAKKDDFVKGWAQVAAEMYAAYKTNENENKTIPVYGLVSTGVSWQFGVLDNNILTIDKNTYSAFENMQNVFNILNWVFCECRKNIDKILEIEKQQGE